MSKQNTISGYLNEKLFKITLLQKCITRCEYMINFFFNLKGFLININKHNLPSVSYNYLFLF